MHTDRERGKHAVSCRVHAASCTPRPRHATRTEVRNRKKKKKQGAARNPFIHSFYIPRWQARVSFLQWEGVYDVTSASINSRPSPLQFSDRPSCFDETSRTQRSWDWCNHIFLHPFSHEQFTPHSAPQPSHPFRSVIFFEGKGARNARK